MNVEHPEILQHMKIRKTDTEIWDQRWFKKMKPHHKLAHNYIKDKCNHAGVWSMDIIQMKDDLMIETFDLNDFLFEVNRDFDPITGDEIERERFKRVNEKYLWITGYISFHWGGSDGKCSPDYGAVRTALAFLEGLGTLQEGIDKGFITLSKGSDKGTSNSNSNIYKNKRSNDDNVDVQSSSKTKKPSKKKPNVSKRKHFKPPTQEEVAEYITEKYNHPKKLADRIAEIWWTFYDQKDWKVGSSKMSKWKTSLGRAMSDTQTGWDQIKKEINNFQSNRHSYSGGSNGSGRALTKKQAKELCDKKRLDFKESLFTITKQNGKPMYIPNFN